MYIGISIIAAIAIFIFIRSFIKSLKDPDIRNASNLRMSVNNYRKYKEWFDKHQELMDKYGTDSKQAYEYFNSFFQKIKNKNEWRRYQDFRFEETRKKRMDALKNLEK